MNQNTFEKILKAFANKRRLAIIKYLKKQGRATVSEISNEINLSFRSTSKHLVVLFSVDILDKKQENVNIFYFLSKDQLKISQKIISLL